MARAWLVLTIVLALPVRAQPVLTLEAALQGASERNLDLKAAHARLAQVREASRKVLAAYLPQLSVGGTYTRNSVEAKIALPTGYFIRDVVQPQGPVFDPGQPVSAENPPGLQTSHVLFPSGFVEAEIQPLNQLGAQLQLQQALVVPALWPALSNAHLGEQVAALSVEAARREILFAVVQAYYGAAGLKEALAVQEKLLEMNQAHEKDARQRYELGAAPKIELLRAEVDRARSEQDVERTRNAYAGVKSSLATLLDRDADFEVERPPRPVLEATEGDRPDVEAARVGVELADGLRRGVWFKYAPSLGLTAAYRVSNARGFTGTYDTWAVGVGLQWLLWDGGLRESELRETAAKQEEAQALWRSAQNKAKDELRRAELDLKSAQANEKKAAEALALARESAQLAQAAYTSGAATYLQVSDANTALLAAELSAIGEQLNAQLAMLRLAKAAGGFP
ncbi:MAG: TolC family protein [Myxococcota bacterium]